MKWDAPRCCLGLIIATSILIPDAYGQEWTAPGIRRDAWEKAARELPVAEQGKRPQQSALDAVNKMIRLQKDTGVTNDPWLTKQKDLLEGAINGKGGIFAKDDAAENLRKLFLPGNLNKPFVVGGLDVPTGMYLQCVAVREGAKYQATGVIIAEQLVLTAGHCWHKDQPADPAEIFIGDRIGGPGKAIKVRRAVRQTAFFVEGDHNFKKLRDDLTLLILDEKVEAEITPIKIAAATTFSNPSFDKVMVIGFGRDVPLDDASYGVKRYGFVPVVSRDCSDPELGGYPGSEFSAGDLRGKVDTCNGDSGGPALWQAPNGDLLLAGTTSQLTKKHRLGVICGDGSLYVRTEHYREWIRDVAMKNGVTPPSD